MLTLVSCVLSGSTASAEPLSLSDLQAEVRDGAVIVSGSLDYGTFAELRNKHWLIDPKLSFSQGNTAFGTVDFHEHEFSVSLGNANLLTAPVIYVTLVDSSSYYDSMRLWGSQSPTFEITVTGAEGWITQPAPVQPDPARPGGAERRPDARDIEAERQREQRAAQRRQQEQAQREAQQRRLEEQRRSQEQFNALQDHAAALRAEKNRMQQLGSNGSAPLGKVCSQLPERERLPCVKALEPRRDGSQEGSACLGFDTDGLRVACVVGAVPNAEWNAVQTIQACQEILGTSKPGLICVKRATARQAPVPAFIRECGQTFADVTLREQCVQAAVGSAGRSLRRPRSAARPFLRSHETAC